MSLIDKEDAGLLTSFFENEFIPTARLLSERKIELIASGPDPAVATYYVERSKTMMEPSDFEVELQDMEELMRCFQMSLTGPESDLLAELFNKILALAPYYTDVEESHEVSPFTYAMF